MTNEIRFALRMLASSKLYAFAATVTLALGIGATTAVFSVIDATLLRPLPFVQPDRLVGLVSAQVDPNGPEQPFPASQIELLRWRAATDVFASIDGIESRVIALTGQGEPIVLTTGAMTSGLFPSLGVSPALGRLFSAEEEQSGAALVVLSHGLWRRQFNADPGVLGRAVVLGGAPFTVIGVMPADFRLLFDQSDAWTPMRPVIDPARQGNRFMFAVGRLRDGTAPAQAQHALAAINVDLAREFPLSHGRAQPRVTPLRERLFGQRAPALWMLGVAVIALLALACANVANLTLGHLARRQRELAVRALLGASGWQMTRLLLIETAMLGLCGGLIGVTATSLALPRLTDLYNGAGLGVVTLGLDWRVVVLALAVIGATSAVCTIVPALRLWQAARRGGLQLSGVRVSAGRAERRLRAALVAVQIALAVMLLSASGTFIASLRQLLRAPAGFSSANVLTMQMLLPLALYPDAPARASFVERMLERVGQVPGVIAAGTTQSTFLPNQSMSTMAFIEGLTAEQPERMNIRHITPGYFAALSVPIVEGRAIDMRDQMQAPGVCMVSRAFARRYFPEGNAIGHRVRRSGATNPWMTIVGIAGDVRDYGLATEPGPFLYVPYLQFNTPTARVSLVVRTATAPATLANTVRRAIWDVDRNQPIDRVATMDEVLSEGASPERFRTWLVTLFGIAGLALAVVGVYAVAAAAVSARSLEASLRLALGAPRWRVVATVLRESSWPVLIGVGIGIAGFLAAGRSLTVLLFEPSAVNLSTVAVAGAGTLALALTVNAIQSLGLARVPLSQCWRGQ